MPHNGTRIVAQPNPAANPAVPGGIVAGPGFVQGPFYGRFILHTVDGTVRSDGKASTVRKP
ncbi:hypothetical protein SAMN05446635_3828 [Burkholderia sp. OK233]|nr:hypothetical protein SAMN05446635_3828 [Burkholderia sp. OK233]